MIGLRSVIIQFSKWIIFYKPTKDSNKKTGEKIKCARTDLSTEKKGSIYGNVPAGKYNSGDQNNVD